jgi:heat shock protein HslJ
MRILLFILSMFVLVIASGCTSTSFQIHSPAGLENTKWVLDTLNGSKINTPAGKEITMIFDSNTKKVSGFGGCNSYFGTVKKELDKLNFSGIGSTKMACDDMNNETNYFSELPKVDKYDTRDNSLYLYNKSGNKVMVLHSKE